MYAVSVLLTAYVLIKVAPWKKLSLEKIIPRVVFVVLVSLIPVINVCFISFIPLVREVDRAVKRENFKTEDEELEFVRIYITTKVSKRVLAFCRRVGLKRD
jgi:hypothetical protein